MILPEVSCAAQPDTVCVWFGVVWAIRERERERLINLTWGDDRLSPGSPVFKSLIAMGGLVWTLINLEHGLFKCFSTSGDSNSRGESFGKSKKKGGRIKKIGTRGRKFFFLEKRFVYLFV